MADGNVLRRWLLEPGERIAGIVYGTVVVMAVIAAASEGAESNTRKMAGLALTTSVVLWLAHVYAHALELSVESRGRLNWTGLRRVARHESSIIRAALLPTSALLLGAFNLISDGTAVWLALGIGVAVLGGQGWVYARVEGLGVLGTAASVAVTLLLGFLVVALEVVISH